MMKKEDITLIKNKSLTFEDKVTRNISQLKKRVDEIEKRLPKEVTLEKVASVNDAILATKLEALSETIKRIDKSMLTKWNVAKIVIKIITALGFLVGLVSTILEFIKS